MRCSQFHLNAELIVSKRTHQAKSFAPRPSCECVTVHDIQLSEQEKLAVGIGSLTLFHQNNVTTNVIFGDCTSYSLEIYMFDLINAPKNCVHHSHSQQKARKIESLTS